MARTNFPKSFVGQPKNYRALLDACSTKYQHMLRYESGGYRCTRSRGKDLLSLDKDGSRMSNDIIGATITKGNLIDFVHYALNCGAHAVCIDMGLDGADCVRDFADSCYDPGIAYTDVEIWNRTSGWLF